MASLLQRLFARLRPLLPPNRSGRSVRRQEEALRRLGQRLFPEENLRRLYPQMRIEPQAGTGRRIVHATRRTAPCELLRRFAPTGKISVRRTACRTVVSIPTSKNASLILTEYAYPLRQRWNLGGADEVLFARIAATSGSLSRRIADFYIDARSCRSGWPASGIASGNGGRHLSETKNR